MLFPIHLIYELSRVRPFPLSSKNHPVLLGRGTGPNEHVGNRLYRDNINKLKDMYMATTSRHGKDEIVIDAVNAVKANGGRFVKKIVQGRSKKGSSGTTGDLYVIAEHDTVVEKTRQAFQYCCRRRRRQQGGAESSKITFTPNTNKETNEKQKEEAPMTNPGHPSNQGKAILKSQDHSTSTGVNAARVPIETTSVIAASQSGPVTVLPAPENPASAATSDSSNDSNVVNQQAGRVSPTNQAPTPCVSPGESQASAVAAAIGTQLAAAAATSELIRNLSSSQPQHLLPPNLQDHTRSNEATTGLLLACAAMMQSPSSSSASSPQVSAALAALADTASEVNNIQNTRLLASLLNPNQFGLSAAWPSLGFPTGVLAPPPAAASALSTTSSLPPVLQLLFERNAPNPYAAPSAAAPVVVTAAQPNNTVSAADINFMASELLRLSSRPADQTTTTTTDGDSAATTINE